MNTFGKFYCWFSRISSYLQSPLLLFIRLFWGLKFMGTGWGKFMAIDTTARFFANLNIPFPLFQAYFVGSIELIGGLLLVIGLFARFPAFLLACTMIVAYLTAHAHAVEKIWESLDIFVGEAPFLFLFASLIILAFGPGFFSLDCLWKRRAEL